MRAYGAVMSIAGLIVLALAGCGGKTTPTPLPPTAAPTATTSVSAPRGQDCGAIQIRANQVADVAVTQRATDCFWQAFQQCATVGRATLAVTQTGVDTVTRQVFTLDGSGGTCRIQEDREFRVVPGAPMTKTYICAGLTRAANGALQFQACGDDGNPIIPPPA